MSTVKIAPWNFIVEITVSNKVLSNINSYKCGKINPICETLHSSCFERTLHCDFVTVFYSVEIQAN